MMFSDSELPDRRFDQASEPTEPTGAALPQAGALDRWRLSDLLTPPVVVPLGLAAAILAYGFWVRF
jgi:hypothetical protein